MSILRAVFYLLMVIGASNIVTDFAYAAWTTRWDGWVWCIVWLLAMWAQFSMQLVIRYVKRNEVPA